MKYDKNDLRNPITVMSCTKNFTFTTNMLWQIPYRSNKQIFNYSKPIIYSNSRKTKIPQKRINEHVSDFT